MLVQAMYLKFGDVLSDGTIVASLSRSQGNTYVKLNDGRRLIAPDHALMGLKSRLKDSVEAPDEVGATNGRSKGDGLLMGF
jgi:hypothetical protein